MRSYQGWANVFGFPSTPYPAVSGQKFLEKDSSVPCLSLILNYILNRSLLKPSELKLIYRQYGSAVVNQLCLDKKA